MSAEPQSRPNLWLQLLRDVIAAEPIPDGPHLVDDDELLNRWENEQLSAGEHESIVEHLADCTHCRGILTEMIHQEAIRLPPVHADARLKPPGAQEAGSGGPSVNLLTAPFARNRLFYIAIAAAACLMVMMVLWPGGNDIEGQLALVERELQTDPEAALTRLEKLRHERLPPASRMKSLELAEQAGYQSGHNRLIDSEFQQVGDLERRARQLGAASGRLSNLRLQAERGISSELALADSQDLTAYEYQLNGRNPTKAFGTEGDKTTERWERDLRAAISEFPDDVSLRLNLGQLLFTLRRCDEAKVQFQEVLEREPKHSLAHIGLGLADFEWNEDEQALQHFQHAIAIAPGNFAAQLNAAITLERMQQPDGAQPYFERARELAPSEKLRVEIDEHLSRRTIR